MYRYNLLPGDRLLVMKAAVIDNAITHSGTYMGNGLVAHISPTKELVMEPLEAFANGQKVQVIQNGGISQGLLHERFELCKIDPSYHLLGNNCEHLCSFLETGKAMSPQLHGSVAGFVGGLVATKVLDVKNPLVSVGLVALTTLAGAKLGAPRPKAKQEIYSPTY